MEGLVYGLTKIPHDATAKWYQRPAPLTVIVVILLVILEYLVQIIWISECLRAGSLLWSASSC